MVAMTTIHIADFVHNKRVKSCDGTPLTPPEENDKKPKVLCEECRKVVLARGK